MAISHHSIKVIITELYICNLTPLLIYNQLLLLQILNNNTKNTNTNIYNFFKPQILLKLNIKPK